MVLDLEPDAKSTDPSVQLRRVVLAFTDIEGSTPLWERAPVAMEAGLHLHNATLRRLIAEHRGYEVTTEGDAFMVAFQSALNAVCWCLACQEALYDLEWPEAVCVDLGEHRLKGREQVDRLWQVLPR